MNYQVTLNFNDGTHNYDLPHIQDIKDPKEGIKATVIEGTRADGAIIIPGGKKSQEITVSGTVLQDGEEYKDIVEAINEIKTNITTDVATLTLKHYDSGWTNDWSYTVRRIGEITFGDTLRVNQLNYTITFKVIAY